MLSDAIDICERMFQKSTFKEKQTLQQELIKLIIEDNNLVDYGTNITVLNKVIMNYRDWPGRETEATLIQLVKEMYGEF